MKYDVSGPQGVAASLTATVTCNAALAEPVKNAIEVVAKDPVVMNYGAYVAITCAVFAGVQCIIAVEKWWRERKAFIRSQENAVKKREVKESYKQEYQD